jgi:hypothetical protein
LVLQEAGYLAKSESPATFRDLANAVIRNFSAGEALGRAQEMVDIYRLLQKEFGGWSLHKWSNS